MIDKDIIVLNGTGGSGKDTFVDFCSKYRDIVNFSIRIFHIEPINIDWLFKEISMKF